MGHALRDQIYNVSLVQGEVILNDSGSFKVIEVYFLLQEFLGDLHHFSGIKHHESILTNFAERRLYERTSVRQLEGTLETYLLGSLVENLLRNSDGNQHLLDFGLFIFRWQNIDKIVFVFLEFQVIEIVDDDVFFALVCWSLSGHNEVVTFLFLLQAGPVIRLQIF